MSERLTPLLFVGILFLVILMAGAIWLGQGHALVLLALGGVLLLLAVLFAFAAMMKIIDLSDRTQALGLPEGSVRAMIALALVALFAVLAAFAFQGGSDERLTSQTREQVATFRNQNPKLDTIIVLPEARADTFTIVVPARPRVLDEFTKTIMATVGTLMTAITAFYFGGRTASDAERTKPSPPRLHTVTPTTHPVDKPVLALQLAGEGLNNIKRVQLRSGNRQVEATGVNSSETGLVCQVPIGPETTPPGKWDVLVLDASGVSAELAQALEITPSPAPN
jgi:hypothetical protein